MEAERGGRSVGGSESIQTKDPEYTQGLKDRGAKWSLGVLVEMVQLDREGANVETIQPGFRTNPFLQYGMYDFDHNYGNAVNKLQDKVIAFNENGSGWVLKNVQGL